MKVAVIQFPGSNCDQDAIAALREGLKVEAEYVWRDATSLAGFDAVFIPGGFTYGDYLRCGAIAARSPIMEVVKRYALEGGPVIGVCNGFQILCEAGLLPGALLRNEAQKFRCRFVHLQAINRTSAWTANVDRTLKIPIAHGEGRYIADESTLRRLHDENLIAFKYVAGPGEGPDEANPNGSLEDIAGVINERGNVMGMMPHPERAFSEALGSADGLKILIALKTLAVCAASR